MKMIKGGVTQPRGFKANGISAGIKRSGKLDLALIVSDTPAAAACVFTKNSIKAAPVIVTQQKIHNARAQAIITNSGNANCFTGSFGILYAQKTAELIAKLLKIETNDVLVASTGIIGKPLPFKKIEKAAPALVKGLSNGGGPKAAKAILTTDKCTKEIAVEIILGGKKVHIGACAKGSGMIQPDMATMLCFITTDAAIEANLLKMALIQAVHQSFNCISVDGCMSTNDMVAVLANKAAQNKPIVGLGKDFRIFSEALNFICSNLAKKIVRDAEGGTKFIEITVEKAASELQAKAAALAIANSNLVKTAAFGSDPNWGRVAAAVGSLGLDVTEKELKIKFSSFKKKDIQITVDLNLGRCGVKIYTCDLSVEYVRINGRYN